MSSTKKKLSLSPRSEALKRKHENENKYPKKHAKCNSENLFNEHNFIKACELVLTKFEEDTSNRYHLPNCLRNWAHKNPYQKHIYKEPPHAEETFNIHMRSNKWCEALQVSFLSITPTQYLSWNVLKNIVKIMLNAHEDRLSEYHITYLIHKCQQVLSMNIRMHPPHSLELWNHYNRFLTSPMDSEKDKGLEETTKTEREKYGSKLGIFHYCINRLLSELRADSKDDPLLNIEDEIPESIQHTIQEYHWIKSRLQIYETLKRTDRIDRLMAVLESMIELLGFDLALFHSRHSSRQKDRRIKLLMVELVSPLETNHSTEDTTSKIIKIFVYFVHLNYPEKYIKTMSSWINILAETLNECGSALYKKIIDTYYPGKVCFQIADKFYKIMADLPPESILKILERLTPAPLKYSIALLHVQKLLGPEEGDIISILKNTVENRLWNKFPETITEIKKEMNDTPKCITSDNILKQLAIICTNHNKNCSIDKKNVYLKFESVGSDFVRDRNYIMRILCITFHAYLDNYKIPRLQKTLLQLKNESNDIQFQDSKEQLIKKHSGDSLKQYIDMNRKIYTGLKEYFILLKSLKIKNNLPEGCLYIFEKVIDFNEL